MQHITYLHSMTYNNHENIAYDIPMVGEVNDLRLLRNMQQSTCNSLFSYDLLEPQDSKILFAFKLKFQFQFQLVPRHLGYLHRKMPVQKTYTDNCKSSSQAFSQGFSMQIFDSAQL